MRSIANIGIKGAQEAQRANLQVIAAMKPRGAFGRAIQYATIEAHRYLSSITHVDTGAYRASQRMKLYLGGFLGLGPRGVIFPSESVVNPRTGAKPAVYALYEESRGGSHAAYRRTVSERADRIAEGARRMLYRGLP